MFAVDQRHLPPDDTRTNTNTAPISACSGSGAGAASARRAAKCWPLERPRPASEYYNGGPMKRELMEHIGTTILNMLNGGHYGRGSDSHGARAKFGRRFTGRISFIATTSRTRITDTTQAAQRALRRRPGAGRGRTDRVALRLVHQRQLRAGRQSRHGHRPIRHRRQRQSQCLRRRPVGRLVQQPATIDGSMIFRSG